MNNTQLNYRYRDAHNYKQFGAVVFLNPSGMSVEEATALLLPLLILGEFFVPDDWGLPRLEWFVRHKPRLSGRSGSFWLKPGGYSDPFSNPPR